MRFKYLFFVIMISFLIQPNLLMAQNKFGIKTGINFSTFQSNLGSPYKQGAFFGLNLDLPNVGNLILSGEINYRTRGGIIKSKTITPLSDYVPLWEYDIHSLAGYLELAVFFLYHFEIKKAISFFIKTGPSLEGAVKGYSYLVRKKLIIDNIGPESDKYRSEYFWNWGGGMITSKWGGCLNLGFGVQVNRFNIEVRFNFAVHQMGSTPDVGPIIKKSRMISILLGMVIW